MIPFYTQPGKSLLNIIKIWVGTLKENYSNQPFVITLYSLYDTHDVIDYLMSESQYCKFVISAQESRHGDIWNLLKENIKRRE